MTAAALDGKIYVIGGAVKQASGALVLGTVERYDPAADTWEKRADMPTPSSLEGVFPNE